MSKSSFVLQALKILGPEEVLKLSEVLRVKQVPLKKAAGEELIVWNDAPEVPKKKLSQKEEESNVLDFPKKSIRDLAPMEPESTENVEGEKSTLITSDMVLWQREINRESTDNVHKLDAFKGYKKSTEMYVVKESTVDGKEHIRFASTNGVLVNKKQA